MVESKAQRIFCQSTSRSAHGLLDRTVKERLLIRNSAGSCAVPKVQHQEMKTLRPEDLKSYLDAAKQRTGREIPVRCALSLPCEPNNVGLAGKGGAVKGASFAPTGEASDLGLVPTRVMVRVALRGLHQLCWNKPHYVIILILIYFETFPIFRRYYK